MNGAPCRLIILPIRQCLAWMSFSVVMTSKSPQKKKTTERNKSPVRATPIISNFCTHFRLICFELCLRYFIWWHRCFPLSSPGSGGPSENLISFLSLLRPRHLFWVAGPLALMRLLWGPFGSKQNKTVLESSEIRVYISRRVYGSNPMSGTKTPYNYSSPNTS